MEAGNHSPTAYRLHPRTILRLRGPDRERFLNGQVTQDVRLAKGERAVQAALLNAKGQLDAICWIRDHDDSFLLDAPIELREALFARLDRYLIADEVELTDESDQWHLTFFRGPIEEPAEVAFFSIDRTGVPAREALTREPLELDRVRVADESGMEDERIANGVPKWGAELTPGLLPPEAGLDRTAISYEKGCYLGQEVISRMKRAGKTNQHLIQIDVALNLHPALPCPLLVDGAPAGTLTSVAPGPGPDGRHHLALGFRSRKFEAVERFQIATPDGKATDHTACHARRLA